MAGPVGLWALLDLAAFSFSCLTNSWDWPTFLSLLPRWNFPDGLPEERPELEVRDACHGTNQNSLSNPNSQCNSENETASEPVSLRQQVPSISTPADDPQVQFDVFCLHIGEETCVRELRIHASRVRAVLSLQPFSRVSLQQKTSLHLWIPSREACVDRNWTSQPTIIYQWGISLFPLCHPKGTRAVEIPPRSRPRPLRGQC